MDRTQTRLRRELPELHNWREQDAVSPPTPGTLHLWKIGLDGPAHPLGPAYATLSPREQARADRLKIARERSRYVSVHHSLRRILSQYLRCLPHQIDFSYGPRGKPRIAFPITALEFNLTHSADLALLAVTTHTAIGIDCERVRERGQLQAIAERMFTPSQVQHLASLTSEARLRGFYRFWTALEADLKADGDGLFHARSQRAQERLDRRNFVPQSGFVGALACRRRLPAIEKWQTYRLVD
mgnify:CR=1 FL=1